MWYSIHTCSIYLALTSTLHFHTLWISLSLSVRTHTKITTYHNSLSNGFHRCKHNATRCGNINTKLSKIALDMESFSYVCDNKYIWNLASSVAMRYHERLYIVFVWLRGLFNYVTPNTVILHLSLGAKLDILSRQLFTDSYIAETFSSASADQTWRRNRYPLYDDALGRIKVHNCLYNSICYTNFTHFSLWCNRKL